MMTDPIKPIDDPNPPKSLLLTPIPPAVVVDPATDLPEKRSLVGGVSNPPVLEHGRIQDNNLTNQDGQSLENNSLTTGFSGVSGDDTTGDPKQGSMPPSDEKFKPVQDKVSGKTVIVRNRNVEDKVEELQALMKKAHDSLGDAQVGDISTGHPYWGLQEEARKFGKTHGLL